MAPSKPRARSARTSESIFRAGKRPSGLTDRWCRYQSPASTEVKTSYPVRLQSFRKKDEKPEDRPPPDDHGNPSVDFHGEKRSNATHESKTDPESKLARKSNAAAAKLSYSQHALIENRNGLLVDIRIAEANGRAECMTALEMIGDSVPRSRRITVGGDKGYDTKDYVAECRMRNVTPHLAQNITERRGSAIDERTTRHAGYVVSQRFRKRIEEV